MMKRSQGTKQDRPVISNGGGPGHQGRDNLNAANAAGQRYCGRRVDLAGAAVFVAPVNFSAAARSCLASAGLPM